MGEGKHGGGVTVQERRGSQKAGGGRRRRRRTTATQQQLGDRKKAEEEETKIWAGLPSELVMRIAACQPVLKVFELQTVCKSWRLLPKFCSEIAASSGESSWFVMVTPAGENLWGRHLIAFSPTFRRWFALPIPVSVPHFETMSSAGGLMFTLSFPLSAKMAFVFNPLTKTSKEVPLPDWPSDVPCNDVIQTDFASAMVANPATGSYHVIRFRRRDIDPIPFGLMHVYDSRSGSWTWKHHHPVTFTGNVLKAHLFQVDERNGTLLAYNAEHDAWSKVEVPRPSCTAEDGGAALDLVHQTVVKSKRRVLLLAGLKALLSVRHLEVKAEIRGFGVWELHLISQGIGRWVELTRTPREYWEGLFRCTGDGYTPLHHINFTVADENLICMTGMQAQENYFGKSSWPPLVYDLALDSWQLLPCHAGDKVNCLGLFSFQPRWDARV